MFAKATTIIAMFLAAGLAGCVSSEGGSPTNTGPSGVSELQFDDETGAIDGLVHDDNIMPIEGAEVALLSTEVPPTTTDADGKFVFNNLAPGSYQLAAQKLGYEAFSLNVEVVAGVATPVDVTLVALGVVEPYSEILQGKGLFGCGMSWRPAVQYSGVAACGLLEGTQFDDFLLTFTLTGKPEDWQGSVYEMQWRSTQAFGKGLSVNFEVVDCHNDLGSTFQRIRGYSPLRAHQPTEMAEEKFENATKDDCGQKNCSEEKCTIQSRVFSSPDTLGASSPADIGITFQQTFEQYISVFYNGPAPEDHTAVPAS